MHLQNDQDIDKRPFTNFKLKQQFVDYKGIYQSWDKPVNFQGCQNGIIPRPAFEQQRPVSQTRNFQQNTNQPQNSKWTQSQPQVNHFYRPNAPHLQHYQIQDQKVGQFKRERSIGRNNNNSNVGQFSNNLTFNQYQSFQNQARQPRQQNSFGNSNGNYQGSRHSPYNQQKANPQSNSQASNDFILYLEFLEYKKQTEQQLIEKQRFQQNYSLYKQRRYQNGENWNQNNHYYQHQNQGNIIRKQPYQNRNQYQPQLAYYQNNQKYRPKMDYSQRDTESQHSYNFAGSNHNLARQSSQHLSENNQEDHQSFLQSQTNMQEPYNNYNDNSTQKQVKITTSCFAEIKFQQFSAVTQNSQLQGDQQNQDQFYIIKITENMTQSAQQLVEDLIQKEWIGEKLRAAMEIQIENVIEQVQKTHNKLKIQGDMDELLKTVKEPLTNNYNTEHLFEETNEAEDESESQEEQNQHYDQSFNQNDILNTQYDQTDIHDNDHNSNQNHASQEDLESTYQQQDYQQEQYEQTKVETLNQEQRDLTEQNQQEESKIDFDQQDILKQKPLNQLADQNHADDDTTSKHEESKDEEDIIEHNYE
eukprot:403369668